MVGATAMRTRIWLEATRSAGRVRAQRCARHGPVGSVENIRHGFVPRFMNAQAMLMDASFRAQPSESMRTLSTTNAEYSLFQRRTFWICGRRAAGAGRLCYKECICKVHAVARGAVGRNPIDPDGRSLEVIASSHA
jgi:hypothetical protein